MGVSRSEWCGYEWPADCERVKIQTDEPTCQSCCIREPVKDAERCVWHVDPAKTDEKTVQALRDARVSHEVAAQTAPVGELLDGTILRGMYLEDTIDFADTALRGADLTNANLRYATLTNANLRYATLTDAVLQDATLTDAVLQDATLTDANLRYVNLTNAILQDANLLNAVLEDADLTDADLQGTDLTDADLRGTDLTNANLQYATFTNTDLRGADLTNAVFQDAELTDAKLWYATLTNANLGGSDLSDANLQDADLTNADLWGADLSGANLQDADLTDANLQDADLTHANLQDADLTHANLQDADLTHANLQGDDIRVADLTNAVLQGTDLTGANLQGTDLRRADLTEADLRDATLARVVLGNTTLSNVSMNHRTRFTRSFLTRIRPTFGPRFRQIGGDPDAWNAHAIDSHELVEKCSEEGLIKNARILTVWDRRARRNEVLSNWNIPAAFGSWLNWQATGYGISVRRVSRNAVLLFVVSTVIYFLFGVRQPEESIPLNSLLHPPILTSHVIDILYFSVVTFTTSPPWPISVEMSQWVAMVETFFGTLLIVFLGYVLGNRDQV